MYADASLGNVQGGNSQLARMICAAGCSIMDGEDADDSILSYQSL